LCLISKFRYLLSPLHLCSFLLYYSLHSRSFSIIYYSQMYLSAFSFLRMLIILDRMNVYW
jgi:hypothetical protein